MRHCPFFYSCFCFTNYGCEAANREGLENGLDNLFSVRHMPDEEEVDEGPLLQEPFEKPLGLEWNVCVYI